MTTILETKKNTYGHLIRLQARRGRYDVICNTTGYCWRYLKKGVSEQEARNEMFLRLL